MKILSTRRFALLCLLLILVVFETLYLSAEHYAAGGFGFSLDDSWIHAVFARHLAEGQGYTFNLNEAVSASTAPLYTLILSGLYAVTGNMVWAAKFIGILGLALAGLFLFAAVERLADRVTAWVAVVIMFTSPALLMGSLSGMEIGLYLISPCAALYAFSRRRYDWMIIALAIGVWVRPEGLLPLGLGWLAVPKEKKLVMLGSGALLVLPYFVFNFVISGYPLPVTVLAKGQRYSQHFSMVFLSDVSTLFTSYHWWPLFLLVPFGFLAMLKRAWWVAVLPPLYFLAAWSMHVTASSFHRYLHPMLPFVYVTMAFALVWAKGKFKSHVWIGVVIAALLIGQAFTAWQLRWTHALAVQNIHDMQITTAKIVVQTTSPGDTVATNDIGAIKYFSARYVLDLMGLVSPARSFSENIREYHPAMIAIFDPWFPERKRDSVFVNHYAFLGAVKLNHNIVCGYEKMSLYGRDDLYDKMRAGIAAMSAELGSP